jgi:hypothetical protein
MSRLIWWVIAEGLTRPADGDENLFTDIQSHFEEWGYLPSEAKRKRFLTTIRKIQKEADRKGFNPDLRQSQTETETETENEKWMREQKEQFE